MCVFRLNPEPDCLQPKQTVSVCTTTFQIKSLHVGDADLLSLCWGESQEEHDETNTGTGRTDPGPETSSRTEVQSHKVSFILTTTR